MQAVGSQAEATMAHQIGVLCESVQRQICQSEPTENWTR